MATPHVNSNTGRSTRTSVGSGQSSRVGLRQGVQTEADQPQGQCAGRDRQQCAFGHALRQETLPARAKGRAHREFATAYFRPRQQKVRQIGAGDQQHQAGCDLKHPDRTAGAADDLFLERCHLQNMTGVGIRGARRGIRRQRSKHVSGDADTLTPLFGERPQFRLSGLRRDLVFQSANQPQAVSESIPGVERGETQRRPDVRPDIRHVGARRHDADHFAAPAVHFHHLTDNRLSAKRGLPQLVRENHQSRHQCGRIRSVSLSGSEQAALRRLHAESVEQMLVHVDRTHAPGPVGPGEIRLARRKRSDRRK